MSFLARLRRHPACVVARRELRSRVTTFTYVASTLFILGIAATAALAPLAALSTGDRILILSTSEDSAAAHEFAANLTNVASQLDISLETFLAESDDPLWDAETMVIAGEESVVVIVGPDPAASSVVFLTELDPMLVSATAAASAGPDLPAVRQVAPPANGDADGASAGLVATTLLLTAVTFNSTIVLFGVVEEKSTRVIEVMLSRARPLHVLAGKIVGICAASGLQFLGFAVVYLALSSALDTSLIPPEAFSGWLAIWLAVGYAISSLLAATMGSLISRPEDAPQVTTPLTLLIAATFVLALPVAAFPDGLYARILSFFPPTAAPAMMIRTPAVGVGAFEHLAALVLSGLFIYALGRWAARTYGRTALAFGSRVRFSQLFGRHPS